MTNALLIGNSVLFASISSDDPLDRSQNLPYYLRLLGVNLASLASGYASIDRLDRYRLYEKLSCSPDVVIVSFGIVELCSRNAILPRFLYEFINCEKPLHFSGHLPLRILGQILNRYISPYCIRLGLVTSWLSPFVFSKSLLALTSLILRYTQADVFILFPGSSSSRIESLAPGTDSRINKAKELFLSYTHILNNSRVNILFPSDFSFDSTFSDGIHFPSEFHLQLANLIYSSVMPRDTCS